MPRSKQDPLIAALIAKLPQGGTDWPVDQQTAWLNLMAMAFGAVYGGDAATKMGSKPVAQVPRKPAAAVAFPFFIDRDGFVRNALNQRVLPKDVDGPIFDMRGQDADVRTIIWKDESTGINGRDLVISA